MCSLIKGDTYEEKFERLLALTRRLANNPDIEVDEDVYRSEKATGNKPSFMFYDDIMEQVNEAEAVVKHWINNYDPTTYSHAILIAEDNNILNECDNQIASFLNGKV